MRSFGFDLLAAFREASFRIRAFGVLIAVTPDSNIPQLWNFLGLFGAFNV